MKRFEDLLKTNNRKKEELSFRFDVYPPEFIAFIQAMIDEMKRHKDEKGDSWKGDSFISGYGGRAMSDSFPLFSPVAEYLERLFRKAVDDYNADPTLDQLVDIANICGMIWCRGEVLRK